MTVAEPVPEPEIVPGTSRPVPVEPEPFGDPPQPEVEPSPVE